MVKKLTWRLQNIPSGASKEEILDCFIAENKARISLKTVCLDVDEPENHLVATIEYDPGLFGQADDVPELRPDAPFDIDIDRDFIGFTPLFYPGTRGYDADIIAVPGLAGHPIGSWMLPNGRMWLRDFLPHDAPSARILTYGYESRISGDDLSNSTLADISEEFFSGLIQMRDNTPQGDSKPIILVGHSLGGLVIKQALASATYLDHESSLPVRLIVFLAAPHQGMNIDALQTMVKGSPPQALVNELGSNSTTLRSLHDGFRRNSERIQIVSIFEIRETRTIVYDEEQKRWVRQGRPIVLVSWNSAVQHSKNEETIRANANHSSIAKMDRHKAASTPRSGV